MKKTLLICAMAAAAVSAGPANAIFKCTTANGTVYQDRPCREGNEANIRIVIPTGEVAPVTSATTGGIARPDAPRSEGRSGTPTAGRTSPDDTPAVAKRTDRTSRDAASKSVDGSGKNDTRGTAENVVPLTADQARQTEPSAKYYTKEPFGPGAQTPVQMNCESPGGEKRVFYLSDGKLTSI